MSKDSILKAYFGMILLTVIVATAACLQGDQTTTIFQKALVSPLFLLASKGLRSFFPENLDSKRSIYGTAEFHFLNAAVLAAFLLVVLHPLGDIGDQLVFFLFFVLLAGTANFLMGIRARYKNNESA